MVVQGRELNTGDIGLIQGLLAVRRDWCRARVSEELCRLWDWRNARGRVKDTPDQFESTIRDEIEKWRKVVNDAGIKPN